MCSQRCEGSVLEDFLDVEAELIAIYLIFTTYARIVDCAFAVRDVSYDFSCKEGIGDVRKV